MDETTQQNAALVEEAAAAAAELNVQASGLRHAVAAFTIDPMAVRRDRPLHAHAAAAPRLANSLG